MVLERRSAGQRADSADNPSQPQGARLIQVRLRWRRDSRGNRRRAPSGLLISLVSGGSSRGRESRSTLADALKPHRGSDAATISNGIVRLLAEYTGRGPTQARTTIAENSVLVVLQDTLTKGERKLAAHGEAAHVLETRHKVQQMMRDDAVSLVESTLQRKVIAFMSANHIGPDMAAEVFALEPQSPTETLDDTPAA